MSRAPEGKNESDGRRVMFGPGREGGKARGTQCKAVKELCRWVCGIVMCSAVAVAVRRAGSGPFEALLLLTRLCSR